MAAVRRVGYTLGLSQIDWSVMMIIVKIVNEYNCSTVVRQKETSIIKNLDKRQSSF